MLSFRRLILVASALCSTCFATPTKQLNDLFNSEHWHPYVQSIAYFQKRYTGAFPPLELIRLDRLPQKEFSQQVHKYGAEWVDLDKKKFGAQLEAEKLFLSKHANTDLYELVHKLMKEGKVALRGSSTEILAAIPAEDRLALSPLDPVFKNSELGKKLNADTKKYEVQGFSIDDQAKQLTFELNSAPSSGQPGPASASSYQLSFKDIPDTDQLRARGSLNGNPQPAGPDINVPRSNLRGTFFSASDPSPFPFGNYPQASDIFLGENNTQHYQGDGHDHSHGGHSH